MRSAESWIPKSSSLCDIYVKRVYFCFVGTSQEKQTNVSTQTDCGIYAGSLLVDLFHMFLGWQNGYLTWSQRLELDGIADMRLLPKTAALRLPLFLLTPTDTKHRMRHQHMANFPLPAMKWRRG